MKLTRRNFLKLCGVSVAMLGIGSKFADPTQLPPRWSAPTSPHTGMGMLIDVTKCVGCKQCQLACKKKNNLPTNDDPKRLSPTALSVVEMKNISADENKPVFKPVKRQCMNCLNPACVSACTVGALQKLPRGPVVYDSQRCIGCRYCMYACPFGVPTFEWNQQFALISKCNNCADRVSGGLKPACVEACPVGALAFGDRNEMLTIANERIYKNPDKYVKHIYGEHEVGGTSMLYLSAVPFELLGFPVLPEESPAEINAMIMHSTPMIAAAMAMTLSGIYWMVKRRDQIEAQAPYANNGEGSGGH